jgi:hypothetical protein
MAFMCYCSHRSEMTMADDLGFGMAAKLFGCLGGILLCVIVLVAFFAGLGVRGCGN